jgi:hypothetical protein
MGWFAGEPTLDEMLADPLLHRVMKADGINMKRLCEILVRASSAASANGYTRPVRRRPGVGFSDEG